MAKAKADDERLEALEAERDILRAQAAAAAGDAQTRLLELVVVAVCNVGDTLAATQEKGKK